LAAPKIVLDREERTDENRFGDSLTAEHRAGYTV
jgi:hypothetical protein